MKQNLEKKIQKMGEIKSPKRMIDLIKESISLLKLDLNNLVVFTEAANKYWSCTPLIASMANAKKVFAIARNSKYASIKSIKKQMKLLSKLAGVENKIQIITKKDPNAIKKSDIITNLGWVRPINKKMISHMKPTAVVSLMCEPWEIRKEDVDLKTCRQKSIAVLGVNEHFDGINTFDYCGLLIVKQLLEKDIEIFKSKILLIGEKNNEFIKAIRKTLSRLDAKVTVLTNSKPSTRYMRYDAIIPVYYNQNLNKKFPNIPIIPVYKNNHMVLTTADLGPKPIIYLHAGGLKVGEILSRLRLKGFDRKKAEKYALKHKICQDFNEEQKKKYGYYES